jgi:hypothetical protein
LLYAGLLVLTELLFTLFIVLFVILLMATFERPRVRVALLAGATLGAAALTRSVLWPFPIVLVPLLAFTIRGSARRRALIAGCCLAGFVIVVGPWSLRNTRLQHVFTVVDSMGGMNLRMGNYEFTPEDRMWDAVALTGERNWSYVLRDKPEARTWTAGQKEKWAQHEGLAYMAAHPGTTIRRSLLKFADFWGLEREMLAALMAGLYHPPRWFAWLASASVLIAYPLVVVGAVLGACLVSPRETSDTLADPLDHRVYHGGAHHSLRTLAVSPPPSAVSSGLCRRGVDAPELARALRFPQAGGRARFSRGPTGARLVS